MGLAISVGILAELAEDDPEGAEEMRDEFERINKVLKKHGLPLHAEPEQLPPFETRAPVLSFPYSCLHTLRRVYAHSIKTPGKPVSPSDSAKDVAQDPVLAEVQSPSHHLLWHSDAEGCYLPIRFSLAIESEEIAGGLVGSSNRLLDELIAVAPIIGVRLADGRLTDAEAERISTIIVNAGQYEIELMVWIALFEACRFSIDHKTAICFL